MTDAAVSHRDGCPTARAAGLNDAAAAVWVHSSREGHQFSRRRSHATAPL